MKESIKFYSIDEFEIKIYYSNKVMKFLKLNHILSENTLDGLMIKSVKRINGKSIRVDLKELHGKLQGLFRVRKGDIRIIFQYIKGEIHIVNIETIAYRGDVYK